MATTPEDGANCAETYRGNNTVTTCVKLTCTYLENRCIVLSSAASLALPRSFFSHYLINAIVFGRGRKGEGGL
jgi:hypothetical protein